MIEKVMARAVGRVLDRLAAAAADELPDDVAVEREGGRVVLAGKRLAVRWLTDARLRWFGTVAGRR